MVSYNDVVHGLQSALSPIEVAFIDHPAVLQLDRKAQLGLTYRVYRTAKHTRYEHSVGTMFTARTVAESLGLSEHEKRLLIASAVLHDIGHYPFSHATEEVLPVHHEMVPQIVLRERVDFGAIEASPLFATLSEFGIDALEVADVLCGKHRLSTLISNKVVDVDRLDYLPRDLYMCNVAYGSDVSRIIKKLTFVDGKLGIEQSGVASISIFLTARALAYDQIYTHPRAQLVETMLQYAIKSEPSFANPTRELASRIHAMSEAALLDTLARSSNPFTADLARRIRSPETAWYRPLVSFGGKADIGVVKRLYAHRKAVEAAFEAEGFLCSWFMTSKFADKTTPVPFPVDDGTDLYDREIPLAAFNHVPEQLFAVYGPTGSEEERVKAKVLVERFAKHH